ncbi:Ankyrin repeat protein [Giardia duodenalis]|uniref:Ankyrin repeat protein n=1 Tax=Giardia intestinalis TaxID=5741 RepID=V6TFI2_GIAIN|nr:Ankyrin repeat protein [Giardia intestinalis]
MDTRLMEAARSGRALPPDSEIQKDAGQQDKHGWTALMYAAQNGHTHIVKRLASLEKGIRDHSGRTALMHGVSSGMQEVAELLIAHEAAVADNTGRTALMISAKQKRVGLCSLLAPLEAGVQDQAGWTAMMHALDSRFDDIGQSLWGDDDGAAVEEICKILVSAEVGKSAANGMTALMLAAEAGYEHVCRLLIEKEAGRSTASGMTAMMLAAQYGSHRIVRMLLAREVGLITQEGKTALMCAAEFGHFECCKLLLGGEGLIHTQDHVTALMYAARSGHLAVVKLLLPLQQGIVSDTGLTAYLCAEEAGNSDCAEVLRPLETTEAVRSLILQSTAGINLKTPEGLTIADRSLLLNDLTETRLKKTGTRAGGILQCELVEKERTIGILTKQLKRERIASEKLENLVRSYKEEIRQLQQQLQVQRDEVEALTRQAAALPDHFGRDAAKAHTCLPIQPSDLASFDMGQLEELDRHLSDSLDTVRTAKVTLAAGYRANACLVCLDNRATIFYLPCQHMVTCRECEAKLRDNRCPLCRVVIEASYVVYTN